MAKKHSKSNSKKPTVIVVCQAKGGVSKSVTSNAIGSGLNRRGKRVLMVDTDPQANLTISFISDPDDSVPTLYNVFKGEKSIRDVRINVREGLDIIPGDFDLCSADMEFFGRIGSLNILSRALKDVTEDYDYVVIDTPPNMGCLTLNALSAGDFAVVPLSVDSFSFKSIRLIDRTLTSLKENDHEIKVAGILITKYSGRTNIDKILEKNVQDSAALLDTTVFEHRIRQGVAIREAQLLKQDIFEYAPSSGVAKDYDGFIDELLERIGDK